MSTAGGTGFTASHCSPVHPVHLFTRSPVHLFTVDLSDLLHFLTFWVVHVYNRPRGDGRRGNTSAPTCPLPDVHAHPRRWPCWPHCCSCCRPFSMPAPTGRPSARSPSTRPTSARPSAVTCRRRSSQFVERGRPDWLASSCGRCSAATSCDLRATSTAAPSSTPTGSTRASILPVDETRARRRAATASRACFSHLKEVYLFGCNTLNAERCEALRPRSAQPGASGYAPADAERCRAALAERYGESNRDRMRTSSRTCR